MRSQKRQMVVAAACLATVGLISAAHAQNVSPSAQNGQWASQNTWAAGVPSASTAGNASSGNAAFITGGNTVTSTAAGNSATFVTIGSAAGGDTGSLTVNGGDLTVADPGGNANNQIFSVGQAVGSVGTFTQSAGTVSVNGANNNAVDGHLYVGNFGAGNFNLSGGTFTASDEIFVGFQSGSAGTINVSGGLLKTGARSMLLGLGAGTNAASASNAVLNISGTGAVQVQGVLFGGFGANSTSAINVSGGTLSTVADNMLLGFAASTNTVTLSGSGAINSNFMFTGYNAGGNTTVTQTGGSVNALGLIIGERGASTYTMSAGSINTNTNPSNTANAAVGDFTVAEASGGLGTFNLSGTGAVNVKDQMFVGRFNGAVGTVNMSGGAITTGALQLGANANFGAAIGTNGVLNISGGTFTQTGVVNSGVSAADTNVLIGRVGSTGSVNQTGGTFKVANNIFLGDFDNSTGTYSISGGTLSVTGNLNVGGAAASNAAQFPPGFALNAVGNFVDSGSLASISITGNLNGNAADNTRGGNRSNFTFNLSSTGASVINVTGIANLNGALIDVNQMLGAVLVPGTLYKLIDAASINGAYSQPASDVDVFVLSTRPDTARTGTSLYVSLAATPEPASMGLFAIASVGLLKRRRGI